MKTNNNQNQDRIKNLINESFGLLTVKYLADKEKLNIDDYGAYWICDCKCGRKDFVAKGTSLRAGSIKSCGCLKDSSLNWKDLEEYYEYKRHNDE